MNDKFDGDVNGREELDDLQDLSNWGNSAKDEVSDTANSVKDKVKDKLENKIRDKIQDKYSNKNSSNSFDKNNPINKPSANTGDTAGKSATRGADTAGKAVKTGAETAGRTAKAGADTAGKAVKTGAETAGRTAKAGADTAVAAGKATAATAQATASAVSTATSATATASSALASAIAVAAPVIGVILGIFIAVALIIIIILIIVAAVTALNQQQTNVPVTTECSQILEYFDRFQKYGLDYPQYGYNYDRVRYRQKYTNIKNSGYSVELAGVYKLLAKENVCRFQAINTPLSGQNTDSTTNDYFDNYLRFYTYPDYFQPDNAKPFYTSSISGNTVDWVRFKTSFENTTDSAQFKYHYYFTDDMFKIALDSFTTSDNQTIMKSVADIQKDIAEQKNIAEGSDDYKQLENEAREQAYKQIYSRMCTLINNAGMKVQIEWFRNSSDSQSYGRYREVKDCIIGATRTNPDGTMNAAPMTVDENDYSSTFYNDMLSTINSMKASNSSAYAVANLALSQVGNNYLTYCNEMNNGVAVDWCGIFAGWCLKKTGVEPADVGYSPSVPTWKRNAVSKGLYKQNNAGYQPKVGDLVIFDYDPEYGNDVDHIEIVVEAQPDCIATVGGNTGGGGYLNSRVSKTVYRLDYYGIDGFVNIPYLNTSGMCAASQSFQSTYGYLNQSGYYSVAYPLNDTQKEFVAKVVEGEYGGDPDGCLLIAQCIRDALIDGKCNDPMKIRNSVANGGLGYDGWRDTASAEAKEAVEKIFQQGMYAVRYKIIYMCTKSYYDGHTNTFQHQVPLVFTYYGKTGDVCFFSD